MFRPLLSHLQAYFSQLSHKTGLKMTV